MKRNTLLYLAKTTIREWLDDKALRLGAALSYYTIFSIAPLLLIVIAIAGLAFGNDMARTQILNQLQGLLGEEGARAIGEMLQNASKRESGILASIIGFLTLLFGATGVVGQLKDALNTIWEVKEKKSGIKGIFLGRILSLAMILAIGFLLLVSLVISASLTALSDRLGTAAILQVFHFVISLGVVTVLFALIFKYLPDKEVKWRNVWIGAAVTSILFTIGKTLVGMYLAKSSVASGYGAAGSLVIILLWVYYNSQILFLGAEFTQVYSSLQGDQPPVRLEEETTTERLMRQKAENDMKQEDEGMEHPENAPELHQNNSPLYKIGFRTGYRLGQLEHTRGDVKKKIKLTKWGVRIVKFLGVKTSAKLGWKGFKIKRKIDDLKKPEDKDHAA
jgi:membrane protein